MGFRILVADCKQETSSFNPVLTGYDRFEVCAGAELRRVLEGTSTEVAGALEVFDAAGVEVAPALAAWSGSGGPVRQTDLDRIMAEMDAAVDTAIADGCDGVYLVFHGAMAGEVEFDPEGAILERVRARVGDVPLVISLDLHAVLTDRMVAASDAIVPYHTYPHTDFVPTGQRAARLLLRLLAGGVRPVTERIRLPMLVRGDELLTATGLLGQAIDRCRRFEADPRGLAGGILIGNPFTDVPDLRSNVILTGDGDRDWVRDEALAVARFLWAHRQRLQAELVPLDEAIALARQTDGLCVFSDAADATSSGASGDSNHILRGLLEADFEGRALLTIVDAPAVAAAVDAGVGARTQLQLGGSLDPARHPPLPVTAYVKAIGDGDFTYEEGTPARAGPSAVLVVGAGIHVLTTQRPVHVMGRRLFLAHGLDPTEFDVVSLKSPNGFRTHYESIAQRIVPVDVPGSTSANLRSLPYERCPRPIFPLDPDSEVEAVLEFSPGEGRMCDMGKKKGKNHKDSDDAKNGSPAKKTPIGKTGRMQKKFFEKELSNLQEELVKLQEWVRKEGLKVVVLFEGRDAAGKGGVIKRITERMSPRIARVVALGTPTEREKTQWYFQRYVPHLPAAGEMVLFDRSWYNRAGVERVMGFATPTQVEEFFRSCPEFERMLVRSGIILIKYWFSVSDEVQESRFQERMDDPRKRWKLSAMDLEARVHWVEYSHAKDEMFNHTDIKQAPWYVVDADDKRKARLNCISHVLSMIPYEVLQPPKLELPPRQKDDGYVRPPLEDQTFVPLKY